MSKTQPSQRTLRYLRKAGYRAEVCEQYIQRVEGKGQQLIYKGGYRRDLFKFMDILAFARTHPGALAVQATTRQQMATHLKKYRRTPEISEAILDWLAAGNQFEIHGWQRYEVPKVSGNGTKPRWDVRVKLLTPADLVPTENDIAYMERASN